MFELALGVLALVRAMCQRHSDLKAPLVAQWAGISLARDINAVLDDQPPRVWNDRSELELRLLKDECELCGSRSNVEAHHVRALKDFQRKGRAERPEWVTRMASRRRKTLIACARCHEDLLAGRLPRRPGVE